MAVCLVSSIHETTFCLLLFAFKKLPQITSRMSLSSLSKVSSYDLKLTISKHESLNLSLFDAVFVGTNPCTMCYFKESKYSLFSKLFVGSNCNSGITSPLSYNKFVGSSPSFLRSELMSSNYYLIYERCGNNDLVSKRSCLSSKWFSSPLLTGVKSNTSAHLLFHIESLLALS